MTVEAPTHSAEQNATQEHHRLWKAISTALVCGGTATAIGLIVFGFNPLGAALIGGGIAAEGIRMKSKTNQEAAQEVFSAAKAA